MPGGTLPVPGLPELTEKTHIHVIVSLVIYIILLVIYRILLVIYSNLRDDVDTLLLAEVLLLLLLVVVACQRRRGHRRCS